MNENIDKFEEKWKRINRRFGKWESLAGGGKRKSEGARVKEFEEPACTRERIGGIAKGRSKARFSSPDFAKEGAAVRHVFPSRVAAVHKSRCQLEADREIPLAALSARVAGQYRRAAIYPISNHREFPLAHANYRPICLAPTPFPSPRTFVTESARTNSHRFRSLGKLGEASIFSRGRGRGKSDF